MLYMNLRKYFVNIIEIIYIISKSFGILIEITYKKLTVLIINKSNYKRMLILLELR